MWKLEVTEFEFATASHGIPRIYRQVHDDLFDLSLVCFDPHKAGVESGLELNVLADQPFQHLFHVLDHDIQVQNPRVHYLLPAECQQLPRQPGGSMACL